MKPYQHYRPPTDDAYRAAPSIGARFPGARTFAIQLDFRDPSGRRQPAGFQRVFTPSMQAFFQVPCVIRGCAHGGFDINDGVLEMLGDPAAARVGASQCRGRDQKTDVDCGLELRYQVIPDFGGP